MCGLASDAFTARMSEIDNTNTLAFFEELRGLRPDSDDSSCRLVRSDDRAWRLVNSFVNLIVRVAETGGTNFDE